MSLVYRVISRLSKIILAIVGVGITIHSTMTLPRGSAKSGAPIDPIPTSDRLGVVGSD